MELPPEAFTQSGRFTWQQARAVGWTRRRLERAVRDGVLLERGSGVYAVLGEAADPVVAHAHLVREVQLAAHERWYAARRSAAFLMGLPLIGRPPEQAQVVRDGGQQGAHGHSRHQRVSALPAADRWEYDGVAMSSPARTVVDIARGRSLPSAVVVADGALRRGLDPADLADCLSRMRRWPGVAQARWVVRFADGRAESPGESLTRLAFSRAGLPVPEPQVEVFHHGRFVGRVDLLLRDPLLAVEFDGAVKFTDALVLPDLLARQERLRDAGIDVLRTHWDEVLKGWRAFGERAGQRVAERGLRALPPGVELRSTGVRLQAPLLGVPDDLAA